MLSILRWGIDYLTQQLHHCGEDVQGEKLTVVWTVNSYAGFEIVVEENFVTEE